MAPMDLRTRVTRSEEHTSELQSHHDLHSFPTRRSSDLRAAQAHPASAGCRGDPDPGAGESCGVAKRGRRSVRLEPWRRSLLGETFWTTTRLVYSIWLRWTSGRE